jgi:hypothetical protein
MRKRSNDQSKNLFRLKFRMKLISKTKDKFCEIMDPLTTNAKHYNIYFFSYCFMGNLLNLLITHDGIRPRLQIKAPLSI